MLQILAVLDGTESQIEEVVKRIVHKSHHRPAERNGRWVVKLFGSRTPAADALDNAARTLAHDGNTVFLARAEATGWDEFRLLKGQDSILDLTHPREWIENRMDDADAWEFCIEEFGDPEEVVTVGGIDPNDKSMEFLWDAKEAKLVQKNVVENNEPGFVKQLLGLLKRKQIQLPSSVEDKIVKRNEVVGFFELLFDWQLGTFKEAMSKCKIETNEKRLVACFGGSKLESKWIDSSLGSFPAVLSSIGISTLEESLESEYEDDFIDALNVRKTFKIKDGQIETPSIWDSFSTYPESKSVLDATRKLKPIVFSDQPLAIPVDQLGHLFMMAWSVDNEVEWLLEVKLPKKTFPLLDGSEFDWTRLHCRDKYSKDIYRFKYGHRLFLSSDYVPRWFFPDPEGDAQFEAVAHRFDSGYPREARVKLCDFIAALPDKTKLSLYTHSPLNPLPITTTVFRGVVKDSQFEIESRYPEMSREDIASNVELLSRSDGGSSLSKAATEFRSQSIGTFWDSEPFAPKQLAQKGRLVVNLVPERGPSPYRHIATAIKKYTRDFGKLGFEYCGTLEAPALGGTKVMCFAGPNDCTGHIVLEWGSVRPEFWSRFESGDILTTNTSNFLDSINSYPSSGLYYRTYYDRPLSKVLKKHRDGIQRFEEHKETTPIVHDAKIEAFAYNLIHFVSRHPDLKQLCN
ncbi:MAG: hypothetical protein AB8G99_25505 [Planctomycetaceae bacterium]